MHELMVRCERCGQELMVDGSHPDGSAMTVDEYVNHEHQHGHMVLCDVCAAALGYAED